MLTDAQWTVIEPLLPPPRRRRDGKGRPPASSRACFEGILWVPRSGARWRDLPRAFPSPATCWRRLRGWEEQGVWLTAWRELLGTLDARGRLEWEEAFLDGSFVAAKKGASPRHDEARQGHQVGTKWMVLVDGQGAPLGVHLAPASPAEVRLAEATLAQVKVPRRGPGRPRTNPVRIIADRGYDCDPLRRRLAARGIELIAPHRRGRRRPPTQDDRPLRRYRRRWKIERTLAWLGTFRRLVVRYERLLTTYQAFFHIACLLITLRHL